MDAATVRVPAELWSTLEPLLTRRYPMRESATFFRFGWRQAGDHLVIVLASIDPPQTGDLDESIPIVGILEPYTVRVALASMGQPLAVGVIHSHPLGYGTVPSPTDDDMDAYFADYLGGFHTDRPYASLIFAKNEDGTSQFSGRVWWRGGWHQVEKTVVVGEGLATYEAGAGAGTKVAFKGMAPTVTAYGEVAATRLQRSTVAVVGVGGTGSAAAEVLVRAGLGTLVLIDHDSFEPRNLERLHGSKHEHTTTLPLKVDLVRDMCREINPGVEVVSVHGNCLGPVAMDWLARSDLVLGCTDTSHSRVALSELAYRLAVPVIDIAVQLDGKGGKVLAEVMQFNWYYPGAPCIYCRGLVDPVHLAAELMPEGEREERRAAAKAAVGQGLKADMYWKERPQLLTVGHLTTAAAGIGAGYAIGLLTGRLKPPATFFQCDILAEGLGYVAVEVASKPGCACSDVVGWADQGAHRTIISMPAHWPAPRLV